MTISNYSELSATAKVVYMQFKNTKVNADDVDKLLIAEKITEQEAIFIKSV